MADLQSLHFWFFLKKSLRLFNYLEGFLGNQLQSYVNKTFYLTVCLNLTNINRYFDFNLLAFK